MFAAPPNQRDSVDILRLRKTQIHEIVPQYLLFRKGRLLMRQMLQMLLPKRLRLNDASGSTRAFLHHAS